jgi:hypothetical protein
LEFFDRTSRKINWEKFFTASVLLSLLTVIAATVRTTFQPWYLIFPISLAAFVPKKFYILIPALLSTILGLLIYVPYVYMTDYAKGYPLVTMGIESVGVVIIILSVFLYFLRAKFFLRH